LDEVSIVSGIVCFRRADGHPMVQLVAAALLLHAPVQVRQVEGNGAADSGKLVVVEKDDAALAQQPAEVEEVNEHAVEPMVPVQERKIKAALLLEKPRQGDLRHLRVKLHQRADSGLLERLQTTVGKP